MSYTPEYSTAVRGKSRTTGHGERKLGQFNMQNRASWDCATISQSSSHKDGK